MMDYEEKEEVPEGGGGVYLAGLVVGLPVELVDERIRTYHDLAEEKKKVYEGRYALEQMEPVPFFYLRGRLKSGGYVNVSVVEVAAAVSDLRETQHSRWKELKGQYSYISDMVCRYAMTGAATSPLTGFLRGELGLIVYIYKAIDDSALPTHDNYMGWRVYTPLDYNATVSFAETATTIEFSYYITDLAWFLREGPLWFLKGNSVYCVSSEDNNWLIQNRDKLDAWKNLRDEFLPYIERPTRYADNWAKLSIGI